MKKYASRLLCILLCGLILISMAACTPEDSGGDTTPTTPQDITEVTQSTNAESTSEETTSNETITEETTPPEKESTLMITTPTGEVFPYLERAKKYLQAAERGNVGKKYEYIKNPQVPITLKWSNTDEGVTHYKVAYATKSDFSDAITVQVDSPVTSLDLYNLYKATKYYVRVTSYSEGYEIARDESSFTTTDLGPRVMNIDGIYNVRDLGGYKTASGDTTLQGLLYRGGALLPMGDVYDNNLTDSGKAYMSEVMGIKTEIDFRTPAEAENDGGSPIPGAELIYVTLGGYADSMNNWKSAYRYLFKILANENNYPIYIHCTGGADRTGTVSFILNALLGVSRLELIQDYEFTSFSAYHMRSTREGDYKAYFDEWMEVFNSYEGDTLAQKAESFLLSAGVTKVEISNFKAIMLGKEAETFISTDPTYTHNLNEEFSISISGNKAPTKLTVNGRTLPFSPSSGKITVAASDMQGIEKGLATATVTFEDGSELSIDFTYDIFDAVELDEYMSFDSNGTVTVNAQATKITGIKAVGYGTTVSIRMKSDMAADSSGGIYVLIGSYGFLLRGGEFRAVQMTANGTITETARNLDLRYPNTAFNGGSVPLLLRIDIVDGKPTMTIKVGTSDQMKTFTYTYSAEISQGIASENAKVTFAINASVVNSLTIYNTEAWGK